MIAVNEVKRKILEYWEANPTDATRSKNEFIQALLENGIVRKACLATGIDRPTVYLWRQFDPAFREAWDSALEDSTDDVEESLYDMAVSRKNVVATIVWLKAHRAKYKDRLQVDMVAIDREIEDRLGALLPDGKSAKLLLQQGIQPGESSSPCSTKDIINEVINGRRAQSAVPAGES